MPNSLKAAIAARVGMELRSFREAAGLPQQAIADLFGWGKDNVSKIETGKVSILLSDYLLVMAFLREVVPRIIRDST